MPRNSTPQRPRDEAFQEMLELFDEQGAIQRFRRMCAGLKAPRNSGAYKYARHELQRLTAPLAAVVVPVLVAVLLAVAVVDKPVEERDFVTEILEAEVIEELDRVEEFLQEPPEFDPVDVAITPEIAMDTPAPAAESQQISPQSAEFNAVAMVRSPLVLRGIYGARSGAQRGGLIARHGGNQQTEAAVMRALRWLRHTQKPDGSWGLHPSAMAGLAVLTFLAHGETPDSQEFGDTVRRAIQFLLDAQQSDGLFRPRDGGNYTHPIAAYALSEAYGLTQNPNIREVAERAMVPIIRGQQANGGWNYNMRPTPEADGTFRSDTSYMGWCAQALAAARMAGLRVEGLEESIRLAIRGFQGNAHPEGGFGYTSRGRTGLSTVGALSMQLLGAGNAVEVRRTLEFLEAATCSFENWANQPYQGAGNTKPIYHWYYLTQAKFHAGGQVWSRWNAEFSPELVRNQRVIPATESGYADHTGTPRDIGYWRSPSDREARGGDDESNVQDTCLTALQLMVYYRYLPTFQTPDILTEFREETDTEDIPIEIHGL